jgi:hypothetical protein
MGKSLDMYECGTSSSPEDVHRRDLMYVLQTECEYLRAAIANLKAIHAPHPETPTDDVHGAGDDMAPPPGSGNYRLRSVLDSPP